MEDELTLWLPQICDFVCKCVPPEIKLTPREQQVLFFLCKEDPKSHRPFRPKEIAGKLKISYYTVVHHQRKLNSKFDVHGACELLIKLLERTVNSVPAEGFRGEFFNWQLLKDKKYNLALFMNEEVLQFHDPVEDDLIINLLGFLSKKLNSRLGIIGLPEPHVLKVMRAMSSFSFKVLGDGNIYMVAIATTDTFLGKNDDNHYNLQFEAPKDKITTITVNLKCLKPCRTGDEQVPFIQDNINSILFYPLTPGQFNLKIWDIRFFL